MVARGQEGSEEGRWLQLQDGDGTVLYLDCGGSYMNFIMW